MTRSVRGASENELAEMESEEEFTFPPAERRVVTQPVDLSINTLLEQWDSKLLLLPDIQREYVWDNGKASRLLESLLLNIPVPVLYFAETPDATYEIIDGHQRVKSIVRYIKNEFPLSGLAVLREYKGLRFHQLPAREQRFLKMRTLRTILISIESHPNMKFEIFERLNTGAITLNEQELRNSTHRGLFNTLLHELALSPVLRSLIGTKIPRKRMVDEELILRFFALRSGLDSYRTPLKRFLNNYMDGSKALVEGDIETYRKVFSHTVNYVKYLFGLSAFRATNIHGDPSDSSVNRALFDAQMIACSWITDNIESYDPRIFRKHLGRLFTEDSFLDSIQRATGDRARTLRRLREIIRILQESGISVTIPFDLSK